MILTNPPFGGEEEAGIKANFPEDKQTAETALLFLQLIMRKLRKPGEYGSQAGGRAAVVVPNGTLSATGVAARIRHELLTNFSVRAIVRLPHNAFAPYTDVQTNLLFFDRSGPTRSILYCEPHVPESYSLSKTRPLLYEWIEPLIDIVRGQVQSEQSWILDVTSLDAELNLDVKNPTLVLHTLSKTNDRLELLRQLLGNLSKETDRILKVKASRMSQ